MSYPAVSWADLLQLASAEAVEFMGGEEAGGGGGGGGVSYMRSSRGRGFARRECSRNYAICAAVLCLAHFLLTPGASTPG